MAPSETPRAGMTPDRAVVARAASYDRRDRDASPDSPPGGWFERFVAGFIPQDSVFADLSLSERDVERDLKYGCE